MCIDSEPRASSHFGSSHPRHGRHPLPEPGFFHSWRQPSSTHSASHLSSPGPVGPEIQARLYLLNTPPPNLTVLASLKGLAHGTPSLWGTLFIYPSPPNCFGRYSFSRDPHILSCFSRSHPTPQVWFSTSAPEGGHPGSWLCHTLTWGHLGQAACFPRVPLTSKWKKKKIPLIISSGLLGQTFCEELIKSYTDLFTQSVVIEKSYILTPFSMHLSFFSSSFWGGSLPLLSLCALSNLSCNVRLTRAPWTLSRSRHRSGGSQVPFLQAGTAGIRSLPSAAVMFVISANKIHPCHRLNMSLFPPLLYKQSNMKMLFKFFKAKYEGKIFSPL